ncbi:hypothetical protein HK099_001497, partial [Clydaea vesicula]
MEVESPRVPPLHHQLYNQHNTHSLDTFHYSNPISQQQLNSSTPYIFDTTSTNQLFKSNKTENLDSQLPYNLYRPENLLNFSSSLEQNNFKKKNQQTSFNTLDQQQFNDLKQKHSNFNTLNQQQVFENVQKQINLNKNVEKPPFKLNQLIPQQHPLIDSSLIYSNNNSNQSLNPFEKIPHNQVVSQSSELLSPFPQNQQIHNYLHDIQNPVNQPINSSEIITIPNPTNWYSNTNILYQPTPICEIGVNYIKFLTYLNGIENLANISLPEEWKNKILKVGKKGGRIDEKTLTEFYHNLFDGRLNLETVSNNYQLLRKNSFKDTLLKHEIMLMNVINKFKNDIKFKLLDEEKEKSNFKFINVKNNLDNFNPLKHLNMEILNVLKESLAYNDNLNQVNIIEPKDLMKFEITDLNYKERTLCGIMFNVKRSDALTTLMRKSLIKEMIDDLFKKLNSIMDQVLKNAIFKEFKHFNKKFNKDDLIDDDFKFDKELTEWFINYLNDDLDTALFSLNNNFNPKRKNNNFTNFEVRSNLFGLFDNKTDNCFIWLKIGVDINW